MTGTRNKSPIRWILSASASVLLLFSAACSSTGESVNALATTPGGDERITFDSGLAKRVRLVEARQTRTGSDLLRAQVEVRNVSGSRESVRYHFRWMDAEGFEVDAVDPVWRQEILNSGEMAMLTDTAPSPKATNFRLEITTTDK